MKAGFSLAIYLKLIRLAIDAIIVPRPPIFIPIISLEILSVNCNKSIAAGTLLIIWLATTEVIISCSEIMLCKKLLNAETRSIFPMKINKAANVANSG